MTSVFLFTPPFTQLNTPYPGTVYLKGFLNTRNISCYQADLGIEVTDVIFSKQGLINLFEAIDPNAESISENSARIIALKEDYINTIDQVMYFLRGKNPTLAHVICLGDFLPEASRFAQIEDLDWAFGTMGKLDQAKFLATMYLEDISDLIRECIDPFFGFSRYAERLGRSANTFDELYALLHGPETYVDTVLLKILKQNLDNVQTSIVGISVPFPGNLYSSFRCAQFIKKNYPHIKIVMGGGFPNTELRSLSDPRVFEFYDFICLDDGEAPLENIIKYSKGEIHLNELKRTFTLIDGAVTYINNPATKDYKQGELGTPDYSDLYLDKYISAIEIMNPMHSLWSDGRWNKLTMAHGCYWGKCTFCDISLDYIKLYEPVAATLLADRVEELIKQTGQSGFHFVDEAAPPALMRAFAIEIIRRNIKITWWTNIRFEKSFTKDLCLLLKASGCIAVSGGLEVASDRLLELIQKGVTVAQVAKVNRNFTEAGIMVHAYLMYGFPTQTTQETIDALEMVRQLFSAGIMQSGFWHQFAMTAHSPVGLNSSFFKVTKIHDTIGTFANNDIEFIDDSGTDHEKFSFGLKKSLLNYMHGIGLEDDLQNWFDFKIPKTLIPPNYIKKVLSEKENNEINPTSKIIWLGNQPIIEIFEQTKKNSNVEMIRLSFVDKSSEFNILLPKDQGIWLAGILPKLSVNCFPILTIKDMQELYLAAELSDFEQFIHSKSMLGLFENGLLIL